MPSPRPSSRQPSGPPAPRRRAARAGARALAWLAGAALAAAGAASQPRETLPNWGLPATPAPSGPDEDEDGHEGPPSPEAWLRDEPWHIVDMHIFTRARADDDETAERWPDHIARPFPERLVALGELSSEAKLDALSKPGLLIDNVSVAALAYVTLPLYEGQYQDEFEDSPLAAANADSQIVARRIQRSPKHTLLLRRVWLQPTLERERSAHVLIKAGKQYGRFSELEGTVQLVRRRHVHFNVDLWLSRFVPQPDGPGLLYSPQRPANAARRWAPQLADAPAPNLSWRMRPLPSAPPTRPVLESLKAPALVPTATAPTPSAAGANAVAAQASTRVGGAGEDGQAAAEPSAAQNLESIRRERQRAQHSELKRRLALDGHRVERVAPLRQSLRLRPNQRQYIDHPLFGLFVKVTPYAPPASSTPTDGG